MGVWLVLLHELRSAGRPGTGDVAERGVSAPASALALRGRGVVHVPLGAARWALGARRGGAAWLEVRKGVTKSRFRLSRSRGRAPRAQGP